MKPTTLIKKLLTSLVVIFLLALDWAALHDIVKGESNQVLEYVMLALSLIIFVMLFFFWIRNRKHTVQVM